MMKKQEEEEEGNKESLIVDNPRKGKAVWERKKAHIPHTPPVY